MWRLTVPALSVPELSLADLKKRFDLIEEPAFAALRDVDNRALSNERSQGKGPAYMRVGRKIYYPAAEIKKYLDGCLVKQTRKPTLIDGVPSRRRQRGSATT
jgi:hypothetical protein